MGSKPRQRDEIVESTLRYERWLDSQTAVVRPALRLKHRLMAESSFAFLRATYYRWCELWPRLCPELAGAARVLAVGDLHVENFGTWRDAEARLVWGVNDLDEAHPASYCIDLVRLAVSARLAAKEEHLRIRSADACDAILEGYRAGLAAGGEPIVLGERHPWLRALAVASARDPSRFWARMAGLPPFRGTVDRRVLSALERLLPARGLDYQRRARVAGLGSLGRVRMVALARFEGAWVAREAKALLPSPLAGSGRGEGRPRYAEVLERAVRARDPFVRVEGWWLLRRLAPDCARVELADLPEERDEARLLRNMGWEVANVHLGTRGAAARIRRDLARRPAGWLRQASKVMVKATLADADAWRAHWRRRGGA
ncbi:MAG TPA: DUF2252 family protein [Anaeromyxobacteraceae bacterium]|nr:DUF2252 family protein [Anaeromyxobacteraceae bacterium]